MKVNSHFRSSLLRHWKNLKQIVFTSSWAMSLRDLSELMCCVYDRNAVNGGGWGGWGGAAGGGRRPPDCWNHPHWAASCTRCFQFRSKYKYYEFTFLFQIVCVFFITWCVHTADTHTPGVYKRSLWYSETSKQEPTAVKLQLQEIRVATETLQEEHVDLNELLAATNTNNHDSQSVSQTLIFFRRFLWNVCNRNTKTNRKSVTCTLINVHV